MGEGEQGFSGMEPSLGGAQRPDMSPMLGGDRTIRPEVAVPQEQSAVARIEGVS